MKCQNCYRIAPNRVWRTYLGGKVLDSLSGELNPSDSHFPEDWLLSTTTARNIGREEFINEGISKFETENGIELLSALLEKFPEDMLGTEHLKKYGKSPAFLLKFLDSSIRLHIQCHPSIPFAKQYLNSNSGKTEGYYILGIRPDCEGYIYLGFQHLQEKEKFRTAILHQDSEKILAGFDKIPVKTGDCFIVPGGIPHAIGEGVFMIEMMEPTDFAVRIEYERGGYVLPEQARFMGRDVDFALSMFDFTVRNKEETKDSFFITPRELPVSGSAKRYSLFDSRTTSCFRAERIIVSGEADFDNDSFCILTVTSGSGELRCEDSILPLQQYDRFFIPRKTETFHLSGNIEIFLARR